MSIPNQAYERLRSSVKIFGPICVKCLELERGERPPQSAELPKVKASAPKNASQRADLEPKVLNALLVGVADKVVHVGLHVGCAGSGAVQCDAAVVVGVGGPTDLRERENQSVAAHLSCRDHRAHAVASLLPLHRNIQDRSRRPRPRWGRQSSCTFLSTRRTCRRWPLRRRPAR